jgi:hypothetical protein
MPLLGELPADMVRPAARLHRHRAYFQLRGESQHLKDPWNIRLVPHYWLGAFFVLAHLAAGTRTVMMVHGVSKTFADRFMVGGAVVAGVIATVIMLGMCGMRVQFV